VRRRRAWLRRAPPTPNNAGRLYRSYHAIRTPALLQNDPRAPRPIASVHWKKARSADRLDWAVVGRTTDVASGSVGHLVTRTFGHPKKAAHLDTCMTFAHLSDQTNGDAQENRPQMSQFHKPMLCVRGAARLERGRFTPERTESREQRLDTLHSSVEHRWRIASVQQKKTGGDRRQSRSLTIRTDDCSAIYIEQSVAARSIVRSVFLRNRISHASFMASFMRRAAVHYFAKQIRRQWIWRQGPQFYFRLPDQNFSSTVHRRTQQFSLHLQWSGFTWWERGLGSRGKVPVRGLWG